VYGDKVDVQYYDAALPEVQEQFREILDSARDRYLPHPLVLVEDRLVMAGHVDAYGIASMVTDKLS
jgi:disulfide oxidoreductase YuzD